MSNDSVENNFRSSNGNICNNEIKDVNNTNTDNICCDDSISDSGSTKKKRRYF